MTWASIPPTRCAAARPASMTSSCDSGAAVPPGAAPVRFLDGSETKIRRYPGHLSNVPEVDVGARSHGLSMPPKRCTIRDSICSGSCPMITGQSSFTNAAVSMVSDEPVYDTASPSPTMPSSV